MNAESPDSPGAFGHCRSCGAPINWLLTKQGRYMPVDAGTVEEGDTHYDYKRHISHFATCKQADMWRSKKNPA
jgi:hypothetical protein